MKKTPTVSILMSSYNDEKYVAQAIDSVLKQDYKDWEFLIVNDNSTDGTAEIIRNYARQDKRIKYYLNNKNKGLAKSLNLLLNKARAQYIARIDSDDEWLSSNKLSKQISFLKKHPEYVLIGTWAITQDPNGKELFRLAHPTTNENIRSTMMNFDCFIHSSVVFSKEIAKKVGNYDESIVTCQDYDLWLKMGLHGKVANINEYMVKYLINPRGLSQGKYVLQINEHIKVMKKYKNKYPNFSYKTLLILEIRKRYPKWFRGEFSMKLKDNIKKLLPL